MTDSVVVPSKEPTKESTEKQVEAAQAKKNSKVEAAKKECDSKQEALNKAVEASVKAHYELMNAQKEVLRVEGEPLSVN